MKINDKIRLLRESQGWSQEEMAAKLNMSTNGYAKIERGESQINFQRLEAIATIFNVDIIELLSVGEEKQVIYLNSNNSPNSNCANFFGDARDNQTIIQSLQLSLQHKDELLAAKENEINNLKEIISLLKSKQ